MSTPEIPNKEQPKRGRLAHWITALFLTVLFLLVHVAAPWGLSLLSTRYGWADGRPGAWNLLALILVVAGIASTVWMITLHFLASPGSFLELRPAQKLLTPGPYAFSRNPMYLFELAFWFGWALFYGSIAVLLGFLFWLTLFNFVIVPWEERDLEARFGEAYRQYEKAVPRWLGKPKPRT
jgi:protein-S-isoprenylcysteine O-methyltransferase Ste14